MTKEKKMYWYEDIIVSPQKLRDVTGYVFTVPKKEIVKKHKLTKNRRYHYIILKSERRKYIQISVPLQKLRLTSGSYTFTVPKRIVEKYKLKLNNKYPYVIFKRIKFHKDEIYGEYHMKKLRTTDGKESDESADDEFNIPDNLLR